MEKIIMNYKLNADSLRDEGNDEYKDGKYFEALLFYNQSLQLATVIESDSQLSLAYANRSAVYSKLNESKLCLENIQLAKKHGYPADKVAKLNEREKKCSEILKQERLNDCEDDAWRFFQLAYPPISYWTSPRKIVAVEIAPKEAC